MAGLYIHIPFCASRCIYCGFYSTTLSPLQDRYINAVCKEMEMRKEYGIDRREDNPEIKEELQKQDNRISTIYLGGGTPSQLSSDNLQKLFYYINKVYGVSFSTSYLSDSTSALPEITMECNPDDITDDFCQIIKTLPVNRISIGTQTFSNARLRFLRRRHTAEEVHIAVNRLRTIGIYNISIDLMFGFPQETLDEWKADIDDALYLEPEHISAYSLMYEEGTPLYELRAKSRKSRVNISKYEPVDEELSLMMYETLINRLETAGYEHYEISNFARITTNQRSWRGLHNSSYWKGIPYIGLGAAAHSYDIHSRQWNVADIHQYIESIERGELPFERETLDDNTRYNDLITTALRTREGINFAKLDNKYRKYLLSNAHKALQNGLLEITDDHIHLTRKGLFISNDVMAELIYV